MGRSRNGKPMGRGDAANMARKLRSEDSWLGKAELLRAWPVHPGDPNYRRVPAGVRNRNENLDTDAVDGRVLKSSTVTDGHVSGRFGKDVLPNDINYGRISPADLSRKVNLGGENNDVDVHSFPLDKANGNLGWNQVGNNKNPVPNFARASKLNALEKRVERLEKKVK
jgi:hypothetical protein